MSPEDTTVAESELTNLAHQVIDTLSTRNLTLATAESLTAGMIAAVCANVPGASAVLRGGLIVYATDLKTTLAGVDPHVIERHGVVSAHVAHALAVGAMRRCGADIGVGITGVAGPGPQDGIEAGTVFLSVSQRGQSSSTLELHLVGTRMQVREVACESALRELLRVPGNETSY